MFGLFNKNKKKITVQKKSAAVNTGAYAINDGIISFFNDLSSNVAPAQAYRIYSKISTVFDAVDKVASKVAELTLQASERDGAIVNHPAVDLLNGVNTTKRKMWREAATSALLTNELYFVLRGRVGRAPLQIDVVRPYNVDSIGSIGEDMPKSLMVKDPNDRREYKKTVEADGTVRYYSDDKLNELVPIIFNRRRGDWRGLSRLGVLVEEVFHIESGNRHNRSLIENGVTPSVTMAVKEEVDEEDIELIKEQLKDHHAGALNSGKALILPVPLTKISESKSNKDMDYIQLINLDETRIYRLYNIPLPLVKDSTMTQSNYTSAIPYLYTDAVLPAFNAIAEEVTRTVIRNRYGDDVVLTYNKFAIPALKPVQINTMKTMQETSALTANEIRREGGYDETDGGDDVLVNAGKISLSDISGEVGS